GAPTDGQELWGGVLLAHGKLYAASFTDSLSAAGAIVQLDAGTGSGSPVTRSMSGSDVLERIDVIIYWHAPAGSTCTKIGGTLGWTGETTVSGTQTVKPFPGTYAFGLSCTDADDGNEATPRTVRLAFAGLVVRAPPLEPVDGGGGAGALSLWWLMAIAALLYLRITKEKRSTCP